MNTAVLIVLFSSAVCLSWSNDLAESDQRQTLISANAVQNKLPTGNVNEEIAELKDLVVEMKSELKEVKLLFNEKMKSLSKYKNSGKQCSKNKLTKCAAADALYFRGGNPFQYAKSVGGKIDEPLDAITACFWVKTDRDASTIKQLWTVLSYAVPERDNEFIVSLGKPFLRLYVKTYYEDKRPNTYYDTEVFVSDGDWHHVCVTWESIHGSVQVYKDGQLRKTMTGHKPGDPIASNGTWIIGQEQDEYGGGFNSYDAFQGSLTQLHVWNKILDQFDIANLAAECTTTMEGNYKAYGDFTLHGGVRKFKPTCCTNELLMPEETKLN